MIYFIQSTHGGPIKIGYAANPQKRLNQIQNMSPVPIRMIAAVEGDRRLEFDIHRRFSSQRLYGEWFEPTETLFNFIDNLPKLPEPKANPPEQVVALSPKPRKLPPEFRDLPHVLDTDTVSQLLGITRSGIIKMFERGDLPSFRLGRLWRIYRTDFLKAIGF